MTAGESASGMHVLRLGGNLLGFYDGRGPRRLRRRSTTGSTTGRSRSASAASPSSTAPRRSSTTPTCRSPTRAPIREAVEQLGARSITRRPQPLAPRPHRGHRGVRRLRDHRQRHDGGVDGRAPQRDRGRDARGPAGDLASDPAHHGLRDRLRLELPTFAIELVEFDIHSRDATVVHLPHAGTLLAGDTVEDTVTYVSEPDRLEAHIGELERMRGLGARTHLPEPRQPRDHRGRGIRADSDRRDAAVRPQPARHRERQCRAARRPGGVRQRRARGRMDLLVRAVRARPPEQPRGRPVRLTGAALSRARACP